MSDPTRAPIGLSGIRRMVLPLLALGLVSNLGMLATPLFMMQVFNRVVPTGNLNTLALLLLVTLILLAGIAVTEALRDRATAAAGLWLEHRVLTARATDGDTPVDGSPEDAQHIRGFLLEGGATQATALPFLPLFLGVLAIIHPLLALVALAVGGALLALQLTGDRLDAKSRARTASGRAAAQAVTSNVMMQPMLAHTMNIGANLLTRREEHLGAAAQSDWQVQRGQAGLRATGSFLRASGQICLLATGAVLLIAGTITPGGTIAATLLGAKVIAAIEGSGRSVAMIGAIRAALARVETYGTDTSLAMTDVADLSGALSVENVLVPRGRGAPPRLDRVSFKLDRGECLAILGESGCGKTTLLTTIVGAEPAPIGAVRLDQSDIRTLPRAALQSVVGYLPQGGALLPGTLAENISRFDPDRDDAKIVAAARLAGVHGLISALPAAYETRLPEDGHLVSPGQRQRIALARALYDRPRYLILDEPNALLDLTGERFVFEALNRLKSEGCTIVMSMHRGGIIGLADRILVLDHGKVTDFGTRREVMNRLEGAPRQVSLPVTDSAEDDLSDWLATQFRRSEDLELKRRTLRAGGDLFHFARVNGPADAYRRISVSFRFIDETSCAITITEPRRPPLEAKVALVRKRLHEPAQSPASLPPDELSLARAITTSDDFALDLADTTSTLTATLRMSRPEAAAIH